MSSTDLSVKKKSNMDQTFHQIDPDLAPSRSTLKSISLEEAFSKLLSKHGVRIEAFGQPKDHQVVFIPRFSNHFLATVHEAYAEHFPLVLCPDHISILISQALSLHINQDPEHVREVFVKHSGKAEIEVLVDESFIPGNPNNDWGDVTPVFSSAIKDHIGNAAHELVVCDFSTTTPVEKIVSEMVLMEAMKSFFDYRVRTRCGIPSIKLEGTVEDWEKLSKKPKVIEDLLPELKWWTEPLHQVLQEFVILKRGKMNQNFWSSFYKPEDGSGGDEVTGFVNVFFPYLQDVDSPNPFKNSYFFPNGTKERTLLPTTAMFPFGLSGAPFIWLPWNLKMKLMGGFVGCTQERNTLALRPSVSWVVVEEGLARENSREEMGEKEEEEEEEEMRKKPKDGEKERRDEKEGEKRKGKSGICCFFGL